MKHFQRNAEENGLIFESLYAKKDAPIITKPSDEEKGKTKEPDVLEKAKVEEQPKAELVEEAKKSETIVETKPAVQNQNIDDWLDDLIN